MAENKVLIAPSMLSSDFARLAEESAHMLECGADWLHMDVMQELLTSSQDGHFVPNLTIGVPVIASLRKHTDAYLDCHLMVSRPQDWVVPFSKAGASGFTFHIEAASDAAALCRSIRENKMDVGVAVKPGTPVSSVFSLVDDALVDMVLIMTVEPGFGGQKFMADQMPKIRELRERYTQTQLPRIEVDGGVNADTVQDVADAGANVLVAGSGIFKAADHAAAIAQLRSAFR